MQRLSGILFALLALIASEAHASKLIAVLPLDVRMTSGKLSAAGQASLEEMLRDAATNALAPEGWTVLTGETTIQVLRDNGVKLENCGDQSCHLEMAREIKADKFISGTVQYVEGQFIASVRLIDTATGRILASERATGRTVTKLRDSFEAQADEFFVRGGLVAAPAAPVVDTTRPQVRKGKVTAAIGSLEVTARPRGLVRLELVDPKGGTFALSAPYRNDAALPGRWKITAKASGYGDEVQTVDVRPDDATRVTLELRLLGKLSITGEPKGAAVEVTGPREFKDEGGLPWEATGLRRGTYRVKVTRAGYFDATEKVDVDSGKTAKLNVVLKRIAPLESPRPEPESKKRVASLFIESRPPRAMVTVNGRLPSDVTTPLTAADVPVGKNAVLKFTLKGYRPKEVKYFVTGKNDHLVVSLDLDEPPARRTNKATLKVTCSPQSWVFVDDKRMGSASSTALTVETTAGRHRVACETVSHARTVKDVTLDAGETESIGLRVAGK